MKCLICDREINKNQHAVECCKCCCWLHKGCSGLSTTEFNKVCAIFEKTGSHSWECSTCCRSLVKRVSLGGKPPANRNSKSSVEMTDRDRGRSRATRSNSKPEMSTGCTANGSSQVAVDEASTPKFDHNQIKSRLSALQSKNNVSNKDVLIMLGQLFEVVLDHKNQVQNTLEDVIAHQQNRIKDLESEVEAIKIELVQLKGDSNKQVNSVKSDENQTNLISEIQDRNFRSKNLIVHNIPECTSEVIRERVDFDKTQVIHLLEKLEMESNVDFKVSRIGKKSNQTRPIRLMLPSANIAVDCLKRKKKLENTKIKISADMTYMQRQEIKKLYDELNTRRDNGEDGLVIRYSKSIPYIHSLKNVQIHRQENQT